MRNESSNRSARTAILVLLGLWMIAIIAYAVVSSLPEGGVILSDALVAVSPLVAALALAPFLPRVAGAVLFAYAALSWISLRSPTNLTLLTIPSIAFGAALFTKAARRVRETQIDSAGDAAR